MEISINWLAVVVAAVVGFVVGWLWYGPLFGKMWKSLMGFTDESMKSMPMKPATAIFWGFIASLVMAYVLAHFISLLGIVDVLSALRFACWIWFGFMATQAIGVYLWEGKSFKLFFLCTAYQFVVLHLMALVLVMM